MSSRAAWRLLESGFTQVFRYKPGKMDWLANGLPFEGEESGQRRAGDIAHLDVPTCHLTDRIGEIKNRVSQSGWDVCVVVNGAGVVMGFLGPGALQSDPGQAAEQAMQADIRTFRLNRKLDAVLKSMRDQNTAYALVTNVEGRLFGLLRKEDVEKALGG